LDAVSFQTGEHSPLKNFGTYMIDFEYSMPTRRDHLHVIFLCSGLM
jgi:hypothetical protein